MFAENFIGLTATEENFNDINFQNPFIPKPSKTA